ncbi:hypothetical protein KR51_00037140 [Rubidibacter lacunae KORDI 51-2]|uniref:Uncharacterized protein n=1 Tax=Rubidibacter lacunae KORDI 51-2 TaxID=582515 RepID=U5DEV6_9CHRO|nr:hypothetical protein KR51_00037140 [Rubidibacter lacunae KORDI 51-2]
MDDATGKLEALSRFGIEHPECFTDCDPLAYTKNLTPWVFMRSVSQPGLKSVSNHKVEIIVIKQKSVITTPLCCGQ